MRATHGNGATLHMVPASAWPRELCEDFNGEGWCVKALREKGAPDARKTLIEFVLARTRRGKEFANIWVASTLLRPCPADPGANAPDPAAYAPDPAAYGPAPTCHGDSPAATAATAPADVATAAAAAIGHAADATHPPPQTADEYARALKRMHVAAGSSATCPVAGCRNPPADCKRGALAAHLGAMHTDLTAAFLATHGFARCDTCGTGSVHCVLPPGGTGNPWRTGWQAHASRRGGSDHSAIRRKHGSWSNANASVQCRVTDLAAAGSTGALLSHIVAGGERRKATQPSPPARAAPRPTPPPQAQGGAAHGNDTARDDGADILIPLIPTASVDLTSLLSIDIDRDVRSVARHLRAQGPPQSQRQQSELSACAIAGHELAGADPMSERGGLGFLMQELAVAYIFFRPTDVPEPYSVGQLRGRAAAWVEAVNGGTADKLWKEFKELAIRAAPDDDTDAAESEDTGGAGEDLPMPKPPGVMPEPDVVSRKMAFKVVHGELGEAWRCASPSPAMDPREQATQRHCVGFNKQVPHKVLTAEHVADHDKVPAIQFTVKQVVDAGRGIHDLRAPGTLPEDNRLLKMILKQGGAPHVTMWINAVARDKVHPIIRNILAGGVRAALIAKIDDVTNQVKGARPLGIT